ncbi:hypothetical protein VTN02DRAFT_103 [Thermoascus thermophilus]
MESKNKMPSEAMQALYSAQSEAAVWVVTSCQTARRATGLQAGIMANLFQGGTEGSKPWGHNSRSSICFIIAVIATAVFTIIPILPVVLRTRAHLPDDQSFGAATFISARE